jgi:hypothetical protein
MLVHFLTHPLSAMLSYRQEQESLSAVQISLVLRFSSELRPPELMSPTIASYTNTSSSILIAGITTPID